MKPGIVLCIGSREERDRICRWLKANGADPNRIPGSARIIVTGGRMTVTEVVMDRHRFGGRKPRWTRRHDAWPCFETRQRTYRIRYDLKDIK